MATEIKLPELGENLTGGEVLDIKVAEGATVTQGQTLLEVEAEKTTIEVPSPVSGKIQQIAIKKGDAITVGQTLFKIEESSAGKTEAPKPSPIRQAARAETEPGAPAPTRAPEPVGPKKADRKEAAAASNTEPRQPVATGDGRRPEGGAPARPAAEAQKLVPAGPASRRLARELGVDLARVQGTAPGGRVTQEDIKAFVRGLASETPTGKATPPPLPDFERWGPVERQPLDAVRRRTAEQMSLSWNLIPHVTQHDQADITDLEAFRKRQEGKGPKLTVTAFALKAAALALQQFPQFNASLDQANSQLVLKRYYHLGVAVDTERGLLVPVVRDVNQKSVLKLAQELIDLAERARQKKLQVEELRGSSFTITNLGGIGGTGFTPIVNHPEVAILGLSRSRLQPVIHDGQVAPRLILPLSLSYDHRVIDGAAAARFTRRVAEMLEDPLVMLLHA
jgi:pyruvate dehydrogenase E2 component (dihydrolipoamide acetyltransferase)